LEYYRKAVAYDKNNIYYNNALALLYFELQQYTEAVDVYEFLLKEAPMEYDNYLYLSEAYRLAGNLPKAIEVLDTLERAVGLNEKISLQKFQLYSLLEDKESAYAELQKFIDKYPNEAQYYVSLGKAYMNDNKLQEAYMLFSKAKSIDPDSPYLITAMTEYYEKTDNKASAEQELYVALFSPRLDIDSKLEILGQYIATLEQKEGDTKRANAIIDTLIVEYPQEPKLNLVYGNLLMFQKRDKEAQFQYQLFAESNPQNPFGWQQLLKSIPPDSLDQSIAVCRTAISYIPDEPVFYYSLGIAEYLKKEYRMAINVFQTGIELMPENTNALLESEFYGLIGNVYHDMGKADSSFVAFDKALECNPNNLMILNNYSYYLSLERKDLDKAEKMSSITVKAEPTNPTFLDTYGWIVFEQGDYITARIYLENAVKYMQEQEGKVSGVVLEHFGDVLSKLGEDEKAKEYWIKAKEAGDSDSKTLDEKIKTGNYISEPQDNENDKN
jgi:tetratricopeptide (TPR) repeat protein